MTAQGRTATAATSQEQSFIPLLVFDYSQQASISKFLGFLKYLLAIANSHKCG